LRTGLARSIDSGARRAPAAAMPPPSSVVNARRLIVHRCQTASLPYTPQRNKRSTRRWRDYLLLKRAALSRPSGTWFDVLCNGEVVGRIYKANATPVGSPWMWTLAFWHHEDRMPTHGYAATRDSAMAAFAESCGASK